MDSGLPFLPLLIIVVAGVVSIIINTLRLGISPMPSSREARKITLQLLRDWIESLPDRDRREYRLIEAGSGWGGLAMIIKKEFPEIRVVGYERSTIPLLLSKVRSRFAAGPVPIIINRDFLEGLEKGCDIVICYLYPGGMKKIAEFLDQIREKPEIVVSIAFHLPGYLPTREIESGDIYRTPVFLYRTNQTLA